MACWLHESLTCGKDRFSSFLTCGYHCGCYTVAFSWKNWYRSLLWILVLGPLATKYEADSSLYHSSSYTTMMLATKWALSVGC